MKLFLHVLVLLIATSGVAEAGPVAAAIQVVSAWTITVAGSQIAIGSFLLRMGASMALSALGRAIGGKNGAPQSGITTSQTTAGGTVPQRLIFGRTATGGQAVCPSMVYQTDGNPNEWLVYVISLADTPITALRGLIVDGKALEVDGDPAAELHGDAMGATVKALPKGGLRNKLYVRFHDGRQTTPDAYLRRVFATYPERPWNADMVGKGVAYAVVTFKGKAKDQDYQGFPSVKFVVDGMPIWDPRDTTQNPAAPSTWKFSRNPALMALAVLRGVEVPGAGRWGVGATRFMLPQIIAAANVCDQQVSVEGGGTRVRYEAGIEVSVADEPHQALDEFTKAMAGDVADMGGAWLIEAGDPGGAVLSITDGDIIVTDSRSLRPFRPLDQTVNAIHASYPEPEQQWESKEAPPLYNAEYEREDGGRRLVSDVTFPAVSDVRQVRALCGEMLADHRRMRTHVVTLPPSALGLRLGEHIAWSSAENGYAAKLFRVHAISIDPQTLCVALTLVERDPADYDPDQFRDGTLPTVPSTETVVPVLDGVAGWSVTAVDAGGKPGIRIGWHPETQADAVSWTITLAATGQVVNRGSLSDLVAGFTVQTAGLRPDTEYLVSGRLVLRRVTTQTQDVSVRTFAIGLSRDDLAADVLASLRDLETWRATTPAVIDQIRADATALSAEVETLDHLARDNLTLARAYTDTAVQSESVARQTDVGHLAARLDEIAAANTSGNLLTNPDFAGGLTGWTGAGASVNGGRATLGADGLSQTVATTFAVGELAQWRVEHTGPAGAVRVQFRGAGGAALGAEIVTNLPASSTARVASAQHAPPEGAAQVTWRVTGQGLVVDNAALSRIDQQVIARIQSLEAAQAGDAAALTAYKTTSEARFGAVEAAISSETATRAAADSAQTQRITTQESKVSGLTLRVGDAETKVDAATAALQSVYTKSQVDAAISGSIQTYNAQMVTQLGQKASSASVAALDSRVTTAEGALRAQSEAIVRTESKADRSWAKGLFRVSTAAFQQGDTYARVGLSVAASAGGATHGAALYLDAITHGYSRVVVQAERFALVSEGDSTGVPRTPFIVTGGRIVMDADTWIRDLSVGTLKIKDRAITSMSRAQVNAGLPDTIPARQWHTLGQVLWSSTGGVDLMVAWSLLPWVSSDTNGAGFRIILNGVDLFYRWNITADRTNDDSPMGGAAFSLRVSDIQAASTVPGVNSLIVQMSSPRPSLRTGVKGGLFVLEAKK